MAAQAAAGICVGGPGDRLTAIKAPDYPANGSETRGLVSHIEIKILSGMTALSVAILAILGHLEPRLLPDTPGYLQIVGFPAMLAQPRTPLYGWLIAALDLGGADHLVVPAFQIAAYAAAVWLLAAWLRRFGLSAAATLSISAALLFANAFMVDANCVHPELLSIACALVAVAGTVELAHVPAKWTPIRRQEHAPGSEWRACSASEGAEHVLAQTQPRRSAWLLVCAGTALAYVLRPSFLLLVVALPALYALLCAVRGGTLRLRRAAAILVITAAPFLGIASLRAATVGDFNIVSFGGYAMSGLTTLILSDETVARLPDDLKPYAAQVLAARHAGEDSGRFIGIPPNSSGQRSFYSAALAYFDVLARTHDDMIYEVVTPTRRPDESWVDFNRRLTRFALAVVRASPERYAAWIAGGSTRVVGRSLAANIPAAVAILAIAIVWPWHLFGRGRIGVAPVSRLDVPVMAMLALSWFVGSGILTMLMSAPSTRYIETASVLVPPVFIYWAALVACPRLAQPEQAPS
jgi:hypothetical protein